MRKSSNSKERRGEKFEIIANKLIVLDEFRQVTGLWVFIDSSLKNY